MRYTFLLFLLMISALSAQAQLGIGGAYLTSSAQHWELRNSGASNPSLQPPGTGYSVGLDYQFRLKKVRIEFAPELNYSHWSTPETNDLQTNSNWYSFFFNVRVYPFDLKGDCNCPTFSKRGKTFQKGFFVFLVTRHHTNESRHSPRLGRRFFRVEGSIYGPQCRACFGPRPRHFRADHGDAPCRVAVFSKNGLAVFVHGGFTIWLPTDRYRGSAEPVSCRLCVWAGDWLGRR
jgi:hypothetical protein